MIAEGLVWFGLFEFSTPNIGEKAAQYPSCTGEPLSRTAGPAPTCILSELFHLGTTFSAADFIFAVQDLDLVCLNSVLKSNTFYEGATVTFPRPLRAAQRTE